MLNNNFDLKKTLFINIAEIILLFIILNISFRVILKLHVFTFEIIIAFFLLTSLFLIPFLKIKLGYIPLIFYFIIIFYTIIYIYFGVFIYRVDLKYFSIISLYFFLSVFSSGISVLNIGNYLSHIENDKYKAMVSEFIDNSDLRLILCFATISISVFLFTFVLKGVNYSTQGILFSILFAMIFSITGALINIENNNRIKREISQSLEKVLVGNMNIKLKCYSPDECGKLALTMNEVVDYINNYTEDINTSKEKLETILERLLDKFNNVMEKISSAVKIINNTLNAVEQGKNNLEKINSTSDLIFTNFHNDYDTIYQTLAQYSELTDALNHISFITTESFKSVQSIKLLQSKLTGIVNSSKQISDNIKILAINAEIEASDAGENGKRFSVIAEEIRKLSEQSSKTSSNIEETINIISDYIKHLISDIEKATFLLDENGRKMKKMNFVVDNAMKLLNDLKVNSQNLIKIIHETRDKNNDVVNTSYEAKEFLVNTNNELEKLKEYFVILAESVENLMAKGEQLNE